MMMRGGIGGVAGVHAMANVSWTTMENRKSKGGCLEDLPFEEEGLFPKWFATHGQMCIRVRKGLEGKCYRVWPVTWHGLNSGISMALL